MASEIIVHPNSPQEKHFECPACGRDCLLTPLFYTQGAAAGVRHGHGVQHSLPVCRTYRTMPIRDFMVLASAEVPIIRDDVHVSVKLPDVAPLIFSDGGGIARMGPAVQPDPAKQPRLAVEEQARDVAAFRGDAADLARLRNQIVLEEQIERDRAELGRISRNAGRWVLWCALMACVAAAAGVWLRSAWWWATAAADVAGALWFMRLRLRAARASSSLGNAGPRPSA